MVTVIESVLGNVEDPDWKDKLEDAQIDILNLDRWQAQKNRFRRKTEAGVDLPVSLERNVHLHDGDILVWDDDARQAIVVRIQLQDVMVIRLDSVLSESPENLARICLEIGHALGNQHWPAVMKKSAIYVPLAVSRKVMDSVMKTHRFEGITYEFIPGESVIPYFAPHESRRLFGAADATPHSHYSQEYAHSNGKNHKH